jgi:ribosomal protein L15
MQRGTGFSGGLKELYERYVKFGFNQAGMLDEVTAETKRRAIDVGEAVKFDAGQDVIDLFDTVKEVVPSITKDSVIKNEEEVLKRIQEIMQPIPGKKAANITADKLPDLIETKSGLKNNARKLLEFTETKKVIED